MLMKIVTHKYGVQVFILEDSYFAKVLIEKMKTQCCSFIQFDYAEKTTIIILPSLKICYGKPYPWVPCDGQVIFCAYELRRVAMSMVTVDTHYVG